MASRTTRAAFVILALTSPLAACVQPPTEQTSAAPDVQTVAAVRQEPPDGAVLLQTCRALALQDATYEDKRAVGSRVMPSNNNAWQQSTGRPGPYGTVVLVVVAGTNSLGHHVDTYQCEFAGTAMTAMNRLPDPERQSQPRRR